MEIRTEFHKRLTEIQDDILFMGNMVEEAINRAMEALKERDLSLANQVIADDLKVNKKRFDCLARVVGSVFRGENILKGELFFSRKCD